MKIKIGNDSSNDLVLNGRYISDFHAEIVQKEGNYYISDLNSTFGTFVNGKRIESENYLLKSYDKVKIGTQLIDWESEFSGDELEKNPIYLKDLFLRSGKVEKSDYRIAVLILVSFAILAPFVSYSSIVAIDARFGLEFYELANPITIVSELVIFYIVLNLTKKVLKR